MSIAHPSGNDLESMSEFYNNFFLRAVTLALLISHNTCYSRRHNPQHAAICIDVAHDSMDFTWVVWRLECIGLSGFCLALQDSLAGVRVMVEIRRLAQQLGFISTIAWIVSGGGCLRLHNF